MTKLSVVVLTNNEENNILDCIESVTFADEVIIVDDYSEDRTLEVVKNRRKRNVKILKNHLSRDFSKQRNFGLSIAKNEWVLFLDADERVSEDLFDEIRLKIEEGKFDGFIIKRRDFLWGQKLRYGETGNIKLLRLARHDAGKWVRKVHEVWDIKGRIGELENELNHYPHQSIAEFLHEVDIYSSIRAEELEEKGIKSSFLDIIIYPKAKFFLNYFIKFGFLDGLPGLVVALIMSFHSFLVRAKLWLLNHEK